MVKESSRDVTIKKKRKGAGSGNTEDADIYKKCVEFEEKEALNQFSEHDTQVSFDTCKEIRQLLGEIGCLKLNANGGDVKAKVAEKASEICLRIVLLKKLNRMEKLRSVSPKEQLVAEKQKVDSINLQYQNLLYEANNLNSEYRKCFQFKSRDEAIDLISVDEFLEQAPINLTQKFLELDDKDEIMAHNLRLARLEWELQQRIHLANMCKQLEEEKKKLECEITERKCKLNKLAPLLAAVMEVTKPVQEHLGLHVDKTQAEHKLASLLPDPLYIFYTNVEAYHQVNDPNMSIAIIGDQDEAANFKESYSESPRIEDEEQSDPDLESQEMEEIIETKKRRHRKSLQVDPLEEHKRKLLQVHPLAVQVTIHLKNGPSIRMKLSYYPKLEIVTVSSAVDIPNDLSGNAAREVLSSENILAGLVDGDFGLESPNPCTEFQLKKVGLGSFQNLISELGYVYGWTQKMCALSFLSKRATSSCVELHHSNIEHVMKTIKHRLKYRYALAKELEELEKSIIPSVIEIVELPKTTVSTLTKWSLSNFQAVCQAKHTGIFLEGELITSHDIFYQATISRQNANLHVFVVIKNDYPSTAPMFSLSLNYNSRILHAQNDDNIRDMERTVNTNWNGGQMSKTSQLLSTQMTSLCVALDIYLETEYPKIFPQNTMYIKSARARNRRKPFKFRNIGVGVFTQ